MDFVITKTSSDYYVAFKHFSNLEELINFAKSEGQIIIQKNLRFNDNIDELVKYSEVSKEVAIRLAETEWEIEIYDDYRE